MSLRNNTSLGSFFASLTDMKRIETVCTKFQVRPICISYALLQLTGQGLPKKCQQYFGQYFQESTGSPKCPAIQLHRASEMALLSCISFLAPYTTWQHCLKLPRRDCADPIAFLSLDSSNTFNCLTRKQLTAVLLEGCGESCNLEYEPSEKPPFSWLIFCIFNRPEKNSNSLYKHLLFILWFEL